MKEVQIDGNKFSTLDGFYDEVEAKLTRGLDWKAGRNLDAFNDLLAGGFGVHDHEEPINLRWTNALKSQNDFGYEATADRLKTVLRNCHPSNRESVKRQIELAENGEGETIFQSIIRIIESHDHIKLTKE